MSVYYERRRKHFEDSIVGRTSGQIAIRKVRQNIFIQNGKTTEPERWQKKRYIKYFNARAELESLEI